MLNKYYTSLIVLLLVCGARAISFAQADQIERLWYNEEKSAKIQIYKTVNGYFCGRIVWLKEPNRDGKPKVDKHNPDAAKQNDPIMGLLILRDFKKKGSDGYEGGTIYDPKNGKKYSCIITFKGDKLDVHGYIGLSFIGRTTVWTKTED